MENAPVALALNASTSTLFWLNSIGGTLRTGSTVAGGATTLQSGLNGPLFLAQVPGGTELAWAEQGGMTIQHAAPAKMATVTKLVDLSMYGGIGGMLIDQTNVFFTTTGSKGAVYRAALGGGVAVPMATNLSDPRGMALVGTTLYVALFGGAVGNVTAPADTANNANFHAVATNQPNAAFVASDGTTLFWATIFGPPGIWRATISSPGAAQIASASQPSGLAINGNYLYWLDIGTPFTVNRIPLSAKDASQNLVLASGIQGLRDLAFDANFVYVASDHDKAIYAIPK